MTSSASPTFAVNERVLCYHGPLIYEAKVLKVDQSEDPTSGTILPNYFVHYKGWKQTWDEWVPPPRLLKHNDTNIAIQKTLQSQANATNAAVNASNRAAKSGPSGSHREHHSVGGLGTGSTRVRKDGARGTKRGREEDDASKKPEIKLNVPEVLKVILVDDWEAVTKNNQLVTLPRSPTVVEVLSQFEAYILARPASENAHLTSPSLLLPTIISGLTIYFDRSLGSNLLYRFERPQYAGIRKQYVTGPHIIVGQEKDMSCVYGAEHMLRMLVSLPQMIANSTMDADSVSIIRDYVNELLLYMVKERGRLFQREYESASMQYQNISRS
ncbi:Esa1p-associated factor [Pleurotus ostreatus]|uniref:Chromatin modification-related protein EAF3 n=2 Tax=Pleurotus ostreatus TaxID=5322 RepID=A0A067N414_PLEO1|nr:Esa1p-associated factor [Pleurotus ostreatus]KAF7416232.1 Esa1p-associated factor [Pleurotus ostreatus]KAJ8689092.1 Esa1p-associated factor [Pleurotus ostreatus]KDQ22753.1 hypothetical protein PLEOSDRAFT_1068976 [Pleurotus ostreatus PC15]